MNFEHLLKLLEKESERERAPFIVEFGKEKGYIIEGWHIEDYIDYAVRQEKGFESIVIWGPMGTLKSNFAMQLAYHVYNDWDLVLNSVLLSTEDAYSFFKEIIEKGTRHPLVILDDITSIFPKQLWFINKQLFIRLQQLTSVIRFQFGCIIVTTPIPERVIAPLSEVIKNEITTYPNSSLKIDRYMWLPSKHPLKSNFKKIAIETRKIDMYDVPTSVFMKYNERRRNVAKKILEQTKGAQKKEGGVISEGASEILEMPINEILEKIRAKGIKIDTGKAHKIINALREIEKEELLAKQACV